MKNKTIDLDKFLEEYKAASTRYYELQAQASNIHNDNLRLAHDMYPEIKRAITMRIFRQGMCFPATWRELYRGPGNRGRYELSSLLEPRELVADEEYPEPIRKEDELDLTWVKPHVINRYFGRYKPNHELLEKELGITLDKTEKSK